MDITDRLKNGTVLGAEGYLFELERRGYVSAGPFVPEAVLEHPGAVKELHREFLRAGAEVMVAFTYYAHREKMKAVGRERDIETLNRAALRLAKEVAAEGGALVAGNISNTWLYDDLDTGGSEKLIRPMFAEQARWAKQEGVDFIIAETFSHLGEALIALDEITKAGLLAMITFIPTFDFSIDRYEWDEACQRAEDAGAAIVGLNCGKGPVSMLPLLRKIRAKVSCPVAAQPVAYRTSPEQPFFQGLSEPGRACAFPTALDPFTITRHEAAQFALKASDEGIEFIGICCGGAPHHVRAMAEALGRTPPASRYSSKMSTHPLLGAEAAKPGQCAKPYKDRWRIKE